MARTALVTGAASGIGARCVERLTAAGWDVVASDINPDVAARHNVPTVVGDLTEEGFGQFLIDESVRHLGHLTRIVHCAGIMPAGRVRDVPAERVLQIMEVNYGAMVRLVEAGLPVLRDQAHNGDAAELVVLGSLTGYVPMQKLAAYSASKAAVNSYVEILAEEERDHGVHVLLVAPTAVKTPLLAQAAGGPQFIQGIAGKLSSRLMIQPDDVLDAADRALARGVGPAGRPPRGADLVVPGGSAPLAMRRISRRLAWYGTNLFN